MERANLISQNSNRHEGLRKRKLLLASKDIQQSKKGVCSILIYAYFQNGERKEFEFLFEFNSLVSELNIDELAAKCCNEVREKTDYENALLTGRKIKYREPGNEQWINSAFNYAPSLKTDIGHIYIPNI